MPMVNRNKCNIHYRVSGTGPLILLQHGFFGSHAAWKEAGYVDALKDDFTVATVDSLAHGKSDKPTEPDRYEISERAADLVAVMDDLGQDRAHLLGYSMGGWMAVGVAKHYPERLASLSVGGWNCVGGMGPGLLEHVGKDRLSFDEYMAEARKIAPPEAIAWVIGDVEIALGCCYEHLYDLDGGAKAVANLDVPVLFFNGNEDASHDPMEAFATEHGLNFLSVPGDHNAGMMETASHLAPVLKRFL